MTSRGGLDGLVLPYELEPPHGGLEVVEKAWWPWRDLEWQREWAEHGWRAPVRRFTRPLKDALERFWLAAALGGRDPGVLEQLADKLHDETVDVLAKTHEGGGGSWERRARENGLEPPHHVRETARLDLVDPGAVQWANGRAAELVTHISEPTRAQIARLTSDAVADGWGPRVLERRLKTLVPLLPSQQEQVARFEAAQAKQGVSPARARILGEQYAGRLRGHRAQVIARTEILTAHNQGVLEGWQRKIADGWLPAGSRRAWIVTADCRSCPSCRQMVGQRAVTTVDGVFDTPAGPRIAPPMHPQCRCAMVLVSPTNLTDTEVERITNPQLPDCPAPGRGR